MSNFSAFFKENLPQNEAIEYKVSDRFSEPFKLKGITEEQHEAVKNAATKRKPIGRGQYSTEMDTNKYGYLLCAASITYPDLNNAELQDNYGVKTPDGLLKKMLNAGEFTDLFLKVQELNGFDKTFDEMKDEVKN